ncbi:hypothetical protein P152DRAFT_481109 [Eremomyces bilateralis CBS 781.70]|uniref:Uncharacterized protein n=1 Tax=Eremomyces bilateralis CBS 781.70 TaxID=1392243 RepID=A0A6G1G771_9PEZI|nr:uncharacterized protein P152DRAFT_481109 [Eremomyces bilateralis CBS 781.70]KAF1813927.1 hypothetical protein P152DRAFT_481109 [Eremomyces bilateralis CBS 781.70]
MARAVHMDMAQSTTTAPDNRDLDPPQCSPILSDATTLVSSSEGRIDDAARISRYHMYHRKHGNTHYTLTPIILPQKENLFHPPKAFRKDRKTADDPSLAEDLHDQTFYVHKPTLIFHHPPRTLRRGSSKHASPVCLTRNSGFWRRWTLQFSSRLGDEGVLDPRGVVAREVDAGKAAGEGRLKGYGVRRWRILGESGKEHYNKARQCRKEEKKSKSNKKQRSHNMAPKDSVSEADQIIADQVVHLDWTSPFSRDTRRYHFRYADIEFYWKGTGTVRETKQLGYLCKFNHLKLVARVPVSSGRSDDEDKSDNEPGLDMRDLILGKYTSSIACRKSGILELYDGAILKFLEEYVPKESLEDWKHLDTDDELEAIRQTRLYEVIVATAICMIVGEWQKRQAVKKVIAAIVGEGAGGGGDAGG